MCAELLGLLGAHLITRECVALGVLALQTVGDLLPPKVRKREGGERLDAVWSQNAKHDKDERPWWVS